MMRLLPVASVVAFVEAGRFEDILDCIGAEFSSVWSALYKELVSGNTYKWVSLALQAVSEEKAIQDRSNGDGALEPEVTIPYAFTLVDTVPIVQGRCLFGNFVARRVLARQGHQQFVTDAYALPPQLQDVDNSTVSWSLSFYESSRWASAVPGVTDVQSLVETLGPRNLTTPLQVPWPSISWYARSMPQKALRTVTPLLSIACIGLHVTSLLEPLFSWASATDWPPMVATFVGPQHPPHFQSLIYEAFQFAVPHDVQVIKDRVHYSIVLDAEPGFWVDILRYPWEQLLHTLAKRVDMLQPAAGSKNRGKQEPYYIRDSDFIICGGGHAPILCAFLAMVLNKPILFSIQAPLGFHLPRDRDMQLQMMAHLRLVLQSRQIAACVDIPFLQEQIMEQTGLRLHYVRNHVWYIPRVTERAPHQGRLLTAVFAPSSMFPDGNAHALYYFLYEHVLESNIPVTFILKNLNKQPQELDKTVVRAWKDYWSEQRTTLDSDFIISVADMKTNIDRFVLLPWDMNILTFDELYSSEVPLFLPSPASVALLWLSIMSMTARAGQDYPLYLLRRQHADVVLPGNRTSTHPFKPWVEDPFDPQLEALRYWITYSNWAHWPGVVYFQGIPDMMQQLVNSDVQERVSRMKTFNSETWVHSLQWYRWATGTLLPGS